jgi:arginyl-tRNA synthetase
MYCTEYNDSLDKPQESDLCHLLSILGSLAYVLDLTSKGQCISYLCGHAYELCSSFSKIYENTKIKGNVCWKLQTTMSLLKDQLEYCMNIININLPDYFIKRQQPISQKTYESY